MGTLCGWKKPKSPKGIYWRSQKERDLWVDLESNGVEAALDKGETSLQKVETSKIYDNRRDWTCF